MKKIEIKFTDIKKAPEQKKGLHELICLLANNYVELHFEKLLEKVKVSKKVSKKDLSS